MYILNISRAIKMMSVNEVSEIRNCDRLIRLSKENSYYLTKHLGKKDLLLLAKKLIEKILDLCNAKKHYQSFIRKKNAKSLRQ